MSAVCPSCGVAVVPGYVKCPKCQAPLPKRRANTVAAGGTAVSGGGLSLNVILIGVAVIGVVIAVIAMRGGDDPAKPAVEPTTDPEEAAVADPSPSEPDLTPSPTTPNQPAAADPTIALRDLDRALKQERLWGTVEVVGTRVDVRSGACREATMMPVLEGAFAALREGGVTRVRCVEQGGALVFERDL